MRHITNNSTLTSLIAPIFLCSALVACGGGGQSPSIVASDSDPVSGGDTGDNTGNPQDRSCTAYGPVTFPTSSPVPERFSDVAPDANTVGPFGTTDAIRYEFDDILVSDGDTGGAVTYLAEIEGWIRYPTATPPAEGWPVVLYLHGRHVTCDYLDGFEFLSAGECPETSDSGSPLTLTSPIESFQGYDYMAENLTTQGYVVMSADANDVNDKDLAGDAGADARAQIILHTLDVFRDIDAGNRSSDDGDAVDGIVSTNDFTALQGAMDFSRVGIMGHSRGGQAVGHVTNYQRAAGNRGNEGEFDAAHNLIAVFSLAPTDFDEITVTDTTFVTLLPYCDGDVSNLQGARTFDNSRYADGQTGTLLQVLTDGSNHNDYNTIWTSDDYSNTDSYCDRDTEGHGRLTRESVRRHGEFLMSSFFRLFVGGETQFQPYWEGKHQLPASACPLDENGDPVTPCDTVARLSVIAKPENRLVVDDVVDDTSLTANNLMGVSMFDGFSSMSQCRPTTGGAGCPSDPSYSRAGQLAVSWDAPATYSASFDELDVTAMDHFTLRAGVNEDEARNSEGQNFDVVLTDCGGRSATVDPTLFSDALFFPPGTASNTEGKKLTQNSILIPLEAFRGIDLERLTKLELKFNKPDSNGVTQGDVQFTDLMFQNIGTALAIPTTPSAK